MIPINHTLTVLIFTGLREGRLLLWSKEETRCKSDSTYMTYFYAWVLMMMMMLVMLMLTMTLSISTVHCIYCIAAGQIESEDERVSEPH